MKRGINTKHEAELLEQMENVMICCIGLFIGLAAGVAMGGPWVFIAPAAGFGLGLIADKKLMKHCFKEKKGR